MNFLWFLWILSIDFSWFFSYCDIWLWNFHEIKLSLLTIFFCPLVFHLTHVVLNLNLSDIYIKILISALSIIVFFSSVLLVVYLQITILYHIMQRWLFLIDLISIIQSTSYVNLFKFWFFILFLCEFFLLMLLCLLPSDIWSGFFFFFFIFALLCFSVFYHSTSFCSYLSAFIKYTYKKLIHLLILSLLLKPCYELWKSYFSFSTLPHQSLPAILLSIF